jgi:clan AA aspartic protease (TIGR02281 family)
MQKKWIAFGALAAAVLGGSSPAAAQVRVVVDGHVQDVPDGVTRVISWQPGGRQIVRDEPFYGAVSPGVATITNQETIEKDGYGRLIRVTIVTRIAPIRAIAGGQMAARPTYAPPPPSPQPISYTRPGAAALDLPDGEARSTEPLRIRRDPVSGHFITMIRINGVAVRAIVDTGAANTILAPADARATGVADEIVGSQRMVGVGGYTMLNIARVRSLEVGGQNLGGMSTPVGQEGLGFTLLGQSEIARLGRIVIEDGTMTITPRAMQMSSR